MLQPNIPVVDWQQPIAVQQVLMVIVGQVKLSKRASELVQASEFHHFLNSVIKAHHYLQSNAIRWQGFAILAAGSMVSP